MASPENEALRAQFVSLLRASAQNQQASAHLSLFYANRIESNSFTAQDLASMSMQLPNLSLSPFPATSVLQGQPNRFLLRPADGSSSSTASAFSKKRKRAEKKPKDPNAPKRPQSAYFLFQGEVRKGVRDENPGMSGSEVSKEVGKMWGEMNPVEKKSYYDAADLAMVEYEKVKAVYDAANPTAGAGSSASTSAGAGTSKVGMPARSKSAPSGGKISMMQAIGTKAVGSAALVREESEDEETGDEEEEEEEEEDELEETQEERPMKKFKKEATPPLARKQGKENKGV